MYNMSDSISQGNARTSQVDSQNEQIRLNNATKIENSKEAAKNAVGTDKELGLMAGIKDAISEGGALANVTDKVKAYQKSIAAPGEGGKPPVPPSDPDVTKTPAGYTDEEWEITILEYLDFEAQLSEMKFDELELNQIKDYKLRFKKIKIKRDPLNNILEIFK